MKRGVSQEPAQRSSEGPYVSDVAPRRPCSRWARWTRRWRLPKQGWPQRECRDSQLRPDAAAPLRQEASKCDWRWVGCYGGGTGGRRGRGRGRGRAARAAFSWCSSTVWTSLRPCSDKFQQFLFVDVLRFSSSTEGKLRQRRVPTVQTLQPIVEILQVLLVVEVCFSSSTECGFPRCEQRQAPRGKLWGPW